MTRTSKSSSEQPALSSERAKLLELILERCSRQPEPVRREPREQVGNVARVAASWAQQRLWFIDQLQGAGAAYNTSITLRLRGVLEAGSLRRAFAALVDRHEVLRTVFVNVQGEPVQEIAPDGSVPLSEHDLGARQQSEWEALIQHHKLEEGRIPFDLKSGPLIRARLLRSAPDQHVLLITMHHIISDGWSMVVLIRELAELYTAFSAGRESALEPLQIQYADYALWQQRCSAEGIWGTQLKFWQEHLDGAPPALQLPTDRPRPRTQGYRGRCVPVELDGQLTAELQAFARRHGLTLFMLLHAAWAILFSRLSGQDDIVIGVPVANRRRPELEALIGFFVNTLALRVEVKGDGALEDYLEQVRQVTLSAYDHQDVPFERVVEVLRPQRSLNRHPIFQVMFALQNAPESEWQFGGLNGVLEEGASESSKFDLLISLEERAGQIAGWVNYDSDLFDHATLERWIACFLTLLKGIVSGSHHRVGELPILPESERRRVIETFNATHAPYPRDKRIHQLFEERVEHAPLATAVLYEDQLITYAELNSQANRLARQLRSQGVEEGDLVPIWMVRSLRMLVAQVAVLKCGGVYVPLDTEMPAERLAFIIRDCNARRIIAEEAPPEGTVLGGVQWIDYEAEMALSAAQTSENLDLHMPPGAPACVLYTSASRVMPKGIVVPHAAVIRLAFNNGYAEIGSNDCLVHHSDFASAFEVWCALLLGARVLIVPSSTAQEAHRFTEVLQRHDVTVLWISDGFFNQYTDALAPIFGKLRYLLVGGDSLDSGAIRKVLQLSRPRHLLRMYGPPECTLFSARHCMDLMDEETKPIPIGQPVSNAQLYILDRFRQPVPIGVQGEMYIGGAGVACGYLNRAELTAQKFVRDPFSADPSARLYRTGSCAHWRVDGTVELVERRVLPVPAADVEDSATGRHESPQGELEELLATIWRRLLPVERVGRDDNFFDIGGHSLLAVKALFQINQALGTSLNLADFYMSPTIRQLSVRAHGDEVSDELVDLSRESTLDSDIVPTPGILRVSGGDILLTGGTGFVGRFLLSQLLATTNATIYCLVRAQSETQAWSRIRITLAKWDLWREELAGRIVAIPGDLRAPRLGIGEPAWQMLCRTVETVYHCATSMNHLETYAMAKAANVEGARELLKLATTERPKIIHYISTLSVFSPVTSAQDRVVHEMTPIEGERHTIANGYAASKWVAEKIFMTANERGVPCNIFRLGLVWADSEQGRYDELQREYRILKSALLSGYGISDFRYASPPTAVDYVARALVHLAGRGVNGGGIFHLSAPEQSFGGVFEHCNEAAGTALELIPLYDWICEIRRLHQAGRSLPVVPLIEFAFSMDENTFWEHQRRLAAAHTWFDCARTSSELAQARIVAPTMTDELLRRCVDSMCRRDAELRRIFPPKDGGRIENRLLHAWRSE